MLVKTISTLHDPEGRFLPLISRVRDGLVASFDQAVIAHTEATSQKLISVLRELGFIPILGGRWGESRREALGEALKTEAQTFFVCDFDKILHWLLSSAVELESLLEDPPQEHFRSLGRGRQVFATYPDSWQKTESIVNHLVSEVFGFQVDVMASTCIFNRKAAEVICRNSVEERWGACTEWPLLVFKAGLKVGCKEVEGLAWEDPDRFAGEIEELGDFRLWKEKNYDSAQEWRKRLSSVVEQIKVINRLIYPDYPLSEE